VPLPDARHHQLYRLTDANGVLLYVGISYSAIARLAQHKDGKAWWPDVAAVGITDLGEVTRQEAEAVEREVIRAERPLHNVTHNGKTSKVRSPKPAAPGGIVGRFVITPEEDPNYAGHQGEITDDLGDGVVVVQWFSWFSGDPTNSAVVSVAAMSGWRLYRSHEAFLEAGEEVIRGKKREAELWAQERALIAEHRRISLGDKI
jgi:predicted GIY-YIG superfamily endonuclease